jgi:hypothetical protein
MKLCLHSFSFGNLAHSSGFRNCAARNGSNVGMDWAFCKVEGSRVGCNVTPCNTRSCQNVMGVVPGGDVFCCWANQRQTRGYRQRPYDIFEDICDVTGASTISISKTRSNCLVDMDKEHRVVHSRIADPWVSTQLL